MSNELQDLMLVELLAKLGVDAGEHGDNVKMTLVQMGKLAAVLDTDIVPAGFLPKENRVVVALDRTAIEAAVLANRKAPRASVNVEIDVTTLYTVKSDGVNAITSASFSAESGSGDIWINGVAYRIENAPAKEFYPDSETPERPIFVTKLPIGGETQVLYSYGLTNLIRRICAIREQIG
jgi:hypothetical protein